VLFETSRLCYIGLMTTQVNAVVEQLRSAKDRLSDLIAQKRSELQAIETEAEQIKVALAALTGSAKSSKAPTAKRKELLAVVHAVLREQPEGPSGGISGDALRAAVNARLKLSGKSERGLHRSLPHVLADPSLQVDNAGVVLLRTPGAAPRTT
jgi:hypothetical protein